MKLIPQSIKNLFNKLFRRAPKPAAQPTPAAVAAVAPVAVAPAAPTAEQIAFRQGERRRRLESSRSSDGVYTFNLDISRQGSTRFDNHMVMVNSRQADAYLLLTGPSVLAGVKSLADAMESHLKETAGIEAARVFIKMKGEKFYIDAKDEYIGLPPGDLYQVVVVPKGVNWKPPVYVPSARKAPAETCPMISMPALPAWLYRKLNGEPPPPKPQGPSFGLK